MSGVLVFTTASTELKISHRLPSSACREALQILTKDSVSCLKHFDKLRENICRNEFKMEGDLMKVNQELDYAAHRMCILVKQEQNFLKDQIASLQKEVMLNIAACKRDIEKRRAETRNIHDKTKNILEKEGDRNKLIQDTLELVDLAEIQQALLHPVSTVDLEVKVKWKQQDFNQLLGNCILFQKKTEKNRDEQTPHQLHSSLHFHKITANDPPSGHGSPTKCHLPSLLKRETLSTANVSSSTRDRKETALGKKTFRLTRTLELKCNDRVTGLAQINGYLLVSQAKDGSRWTDSQCRLCVWAYCPERQVEKQLIIPDTEADDTIVGIADISVLVLKLLVVSTSGKREVKAHHLYLDSDMNITDYETKSVCKGHTLSQHTVNVERDGDIISAALESHSNKYDKIEIVCFNPDGDAKYDKTVSVGKNEFISSPVKSLKSSGSFVYIRPGFPSVFSETMWSEIVNPTHIAQHPNGLIVADKENDCIRLLQHREASTVRKDQFTLLQRSDGILKPTFVYWKGMLTHCSWFNRMLGQGI